jgi:hypothetical protein
MIKTVSITNSNQLSTICSLYDNKTNAYVYVINNESTVDDLISYILYASGIVVKESIEIISRDVSFEKIYRAIYLLTLKNKEKCALLFFRSIAHLNSLQLVESEYNMRLANLNDIFFYLRRVTEYEAIYVSTKKHLSFDAQDEKASSLFQSVAKAVRDDPATVSFEETYRKAFDLYKADPNLCASKYFHCISLAKKGPAPEEKIKIVNDIFMHFLKQSPKMKVIID